MKVNKKNHILLKKQILLACIFSISILGYLLFFPFYSKAQGHVSDSTHTDNTDETDGIFTLKLTIERALKANLELKVSGEEIRSAFFAKKAQRTNFYPTFNAAYQYKRNDEESSIQLYGVTTPLNEYTFAATISQPLFTGFSLQNLYKITEHSLDIAKISEKLVRREIIFEAKKSYFSILKAKKLVAISEDAVTQLEAHKEVAQNFYQVGMTPLNDFLKADVELANARQDLIISKNNLEITKSNFNTILRRPINADVEIKDVFDYSTFENNIYYCLDLAEKNRLEIKIADLQVEISEKELKLSKKDYYPSISIEGHYYHLGTEWDANGGEGISDSSFWDITAVASWNFWEWGRTSYGSKDKLSQLSQAKYRKEAIYDNIRLEVKKAYLNTMESAKNIITVKKAIEQAKENFRISEERYKEQMDTSTDVLDARTLLSRTMTNYYNALYDFKIAKASLFKAMGQEVMK